ncbi:MAG: FtsW/RodA/SpoVE family cell cycle protein, partial [Anaerolineales bacterium]
MTENKTNARIHLSNGGRWPVASGHSGRLRSFSLFGLGFLFTGLALVQLDLVNNDLRPATFIPLLVLIFCSSVAAYFLHRRGRPGDPILLPLIYLLSGLGLALITRLAPTFVIRQLFWLAIATTLLLLVTLIPKNLNWLRRYKYTWLIGGLLLLATTLIFGVNPSGFGARLWLQLGNIYFQPSEPLKLLLIVFLAAYLADRRRQLVEVKAYIGRVAVPHPSYFGPLLLMWGFSIVLLVWQRDLGAALLFFGTFLGMLYAATGQARYAWAGALLLLLAGTIGYYLFDVVRLRVEAFLNPWLDPSGRSFQVVQSLLAFANGGLFGQGLGQGLPTAIPVVHTDFVFAAIGEEYGLLGALAVLVCFVLLVSRAFYIALQAKSGFEQLLATGIGVIMGLQILVITAGTLKLMPLTGVTLPFVSYGGSSLVTSFVMVGVLLFIANGEPANPQMGAWAKSESAHPEPRIPGNAHHTTGRQGHASATQHAVRSTQYAVPITPLALGLHALPLRPQLRLARASLTGFLIVAGGLIFWQIAVASFLLSRDDNPRPIIAEQRIRRGRLLSTNGIPVAETIIQDGLAERRYPYVGLSSVTGYYSLRHGAGGTEAAFDSILRGTAGRSTEELWLDDLLHRPLVGRDVSLTIDLPAQVAADVALGNQEGAI